MARRGRSARKKGCSYGQRRFKAGVPGGKGGRFTKSKNRKTTKAARICRKRR